MQAIKKTAKEWQYKSTVFPLKFIFTVPKISVSNNLGLFLIDIDEIFPMSRTEKGAFYVATGIVQRHDVSILYSLQL